METVKNKFGIKLMEDWYKITCEVIKIIIYYLQRLKDFYSLNGRSLLQLYNESPFQLLSSVYSDYEWLPWRFTTIPRGFTFTSSTRKSILEYLTKNLNIKGNSDWDTIKHEVCQFQIYKLNFRMSKNV